jgi:hypothetical protein
MRSGRDASLFGRVVIMIAVVSGLGVEAPINAAVAQLANRTVVTVMLVDSFPYPDADAVVLRRQNQQPHDVILVNRSTASPELFLAAAEVLRVSWRIAKTQPQSEEIVLRVPRDLTSRNWNSNELRAAAGTLGRLRDGSRPQEDVPGIGRGTTAIVYLRSPAQE